mgnify:CR=1 FL=1
MAVAAAAPAIVDLVPKYQPETPDMSMVTKVSVPGCMGTPVTWLAITPVKFGISFTTRFLNQANALVIVYRDGSVQVSTGATEMGQGVNARIGQLVAEELGLERDQVRLMPTAVERHGFLQRISARLGVPMDVLKGGLCCSGMYELEPVSLSSRSQHVNFTPDCIESLSPIRYANALTTPTRILCGLQESPEFIRQAQALHHALQQRGHDVRWVMGDGMNHFEILATLENESGLLAQSLQAHWPTHGTPQPTETNP